MIASSYGQGKNKTKTKVFRGKTLITDGVHDNWESDKPIRIQNNFDLAAWRSFRKSESEMVYSSAYRRAYKEPLWDNFSKEEFISKLQYRSDRRSVEHRHQPWRWDSESEEDEDIEEIPGDDGSYNGGRREFVPREERIDKRVPKQAWEERKEIKENGHAADKTIVLPEKLRYEEEEQEEKTKHPHAAGDLRSKGRNRDARKHHRSSEEKRKHRSHSASPKKNQSSEERKKKAPFLPYGRANEGPVDKWKTHNVLAAQPEVSIVW